MLSIARGRRTALAAMFLVVFSILAPIGADNALAKGKKSQGNRGAIWTTDAVGTQNVNHYPRGGTVYLHGQNFEAYAGDSLDYGIWVNPPNPHGTLVKSGTVGINSEGDIPIQPIWDIPNDADKGPYKVILSDEEGTKSDNFSVKGAIEEERFDLRLTKEAPATAWPGDSVTDTVVITNTGNVEANNLKMSYVIGPASAMDVTSTPFGGSAFKKLVGSNIVNGDWKYILKLNDLGVGESKALTYTYIVKAGTPANTIISDTATVKCHSVTAQTRILGGQGGEVEVGKIILKPETAVNPVSTNHTVTATVYDESDRPMKDVVVDFGYRSSVDSSAFHYLGEATTNAQGEASFTMKGPDTAQTWTIVAWFEKDDNNIRAEREITSNEVTKIWQKNDENVGGGEVEQGQVTKPPVLPQAGGNLLASVLAVFLSLLAAVYGMRGYLVFQTKSKRSPRLFRLAELE